MSTDILEGIGNAEALVDVIPDPPPLPSPWRQAAKPFHEFVTLSRGEFGWAPPDRAGPQPVTAKKTVQLRPPVDGPDRDPGAACDLTWVAPLLEELDGA